MFIYDPRYNEGGIWLCECCELGFDSRTDYYYHVDNELCKEPSPNKHVSRAMRRASGLTAFQIWARV